MSQDTARAILQNIYTFACIADQAATAKVSSWDVQSVHNALQWAAYCQKLAVQVRGRRLEPVLEGRLQEMSQLMDAKSPASQTQCLNLAFLHRAVDVLVERLVHNPRLSNSLLQELQHAMETQYSTHVSSLQLNLVAAKCDLKFKVSVAAKLKELEMLFKSSTSAPDFPENNTEAQTCVRLLLEQLTLWYEVEQDFDRFEKHLRYTGECISQLPCGWSVLVMCLAVNMCKVEKEHREGLRYVQHLIATWIVSQHKTNGPACALWNVSPSLLVQAAEQNVQFCDWFLGTLEHMADTMELTYTCQRSPVKCVSFPSPVYCWSAPATQSKPAFDDFVQHFSHLLMADSVVKNKALAILTSKTSQHSFSVWTDLTRNLITSFT